jgi:large subunit ribosomal protein L24
MVTSGRFRGKTGEIVRVLTKHDRVIVRGPGIEGIVKNQRPTRLNPQGGKIELDRTFHISNVSPMAGGKPTRVRFETKPDGSKVRVAVRTGEELGRVSPSRKTS